MNLPTLRQMLAEPPRSMKWTQQAAIELCVKIEAIAPRFGFHVALTGGCLYKAHTEPERKGLDLVFYRERHQKPSTLPLAAALYCELGLNLVKDGWRYIGEDPQGRRIDLLFPEYND